MNGMDRFADLLIDMYKQNKNLPSTHMRLAEVIDVNPIRIQYGDSIILESRHLCIAGSLINGYKGTYTDSNDGSTTTKEVTVKNELAIGDKVIIAPDSNLKIWFVIDKAVTL